MLLRPASLRAVPSAALAGLVALAAACDRGAEARATAAAATDSVAVLTRRLAEAEEGVKQRDQLAGELAQTARLVNAIDSSLAQVKGVDLVTKAGRRPGIGAARSDAWAAGRDSLLARVEAITALLEQSRARVAQLSRQQKGLDAKVGGYRATIDELQASVERQKRQIAVLEATVDSLRAEGRAYAMERDAARDTLHEVRTTAATVYWVAAPKKELIQRHIVTEEGTKRFLVAGRRTLVPARTLDPQAFQTGDQRRELAITLPQAGKPWRIVSRHDASLLQPGTDGTLRVSDPQRFWSASRYLIIAQD
jgi:hypothetical protein